MKHRETNRYVRIVEQIFVDRFRPGVREVAFEREDLERTAIRLKIKLPKNLGDILYSFRYRAELPKAISSTAPKGEYWIIRPAGKARYCFALTSQSAITPAENLVEIKVPDATPGVIEKYAFSDEQALLAKLRYNRLIDIFAGVTCYSLQNHLRTTVHELGQIETDELYIGVDRRGAHFVLPVQAKGGNDRLSVVQIEQDLALCRAKFSNLICRPIAAQFMHKDLIALFELAHQDRRIVVVSERHYRLVPPDEVTPDDLRLYASAGDV